MKKGLLFLFIAVFVLSAAGCGSKSSDNADAGGAYMADTEPVMEKSAAYDSMNFGGYEDAEAAGDYYEEGDSGYNEEAGPESVNEGDAAKSNRKLITTVNISTETDDVEGFADRIEKKVNALGGYLESSNIYSDKDYYGNNNTKSADITARIPANRLEEFLNDVDGNSNITSRNRSTEDVTLQYTDTEAHERALTLEQQSLEEMLMKAETIDDIMAIQSRLTDVRYRLDSIRSQLRTYDNNVNYSTVYLNVRETKEFTVTKEETVWERISKGFVDNLLDVMDAIAEFLIWFITHIPSLILFGVVVFVIGFIIKLIISSNKKNGEKKKKQPFNGAKKRAPANTVAPVNTEAPANAGAPAKQAAPSEKTASAEKPAAEQQSEKPAAEQPAAEAGNKETDK